VCHAVKEKGGRLGPDLTEVGLRRSLEFLRDSVTDPSSYIDRQYRSAVAVLPDGTKIRGVVLNEDDYSIQLRDMREELRSFLKSDPTEIRVERESLMPANFFALDARTGKDLWHFSGNQVSYANPISYLSKGRQQVAIPIGDVLMAFGLD
jgi:putative heme-binding domain-containing protein